MDLPVSEETCAQLAACICNTILAHIYRNRLAVPGTKFPIEEFKEMLKLRLMEEANQNYMVEGVNENTASIVEELHPYCMMFLHDKPLVTSDSDLAYDFSEVIASALSSPRAQEVLYGSQRKRSHSQGGDFEEERESKRSKVETKVVERKKPQTQSVSSSGYEVKKHKEKKKQKKREKRSPPPTPTPHEINLRKVLIKTNNYDVVAAYEMQAQRVEDDFVDVEYKWPAEAWLKGASYDATILLLKTKLNMTDEEAKVMLQHSKDRIVLLKHDRVPRCDVKPVKTKADMARWEKSASDYGKWWWELKWNEVNETFEEVDNTKYPSEAVTLEPRDIPADSITMETLLNNNLGLELDLDNKSCQFVYQLFGKDANGTPWRVHHLEDGYLFDAYHFPERFDSFRVVVRDLCYKRIPLYLPAGNIYINRKVSEALISDAEEYAKEKLNKGISSEPVLPSKDIPVEKKVIVYSNDIDTQSAAYQLGESGSFVLEGKQYTLVSFPKPLERKLGGATTVFLKNYLRDTCKYSNEQIQQFLHDYENCWILLKQDYWEKKEVRVAESKEDRNCWNDYSKEQVEIWPTLDSICPNVEVSGILELTNIIQEERLVKFSEVIHCRENTKVSFNLAKCKFIIREFDTDPGTGKDHQAMQHSMQNGSIRFWGWQPDENEVYVYVEDLAQSTDEAEVCYYSLASNCYILEEDVKNAGGTVEAVTPPFDSEVEYPSPPAILDEAIKLITAGAPLETTPPAAVLTVSSIDGEVNVEEEGHMEEAVVTVSSAGEVNVEEERHLASQPLEVDDLVKTSVVRTLRPAREPIVGRFKGLLQDEGVSLILANDPYLCNFHVTTGDNLQIIWRTDLVEGPSRKRLTALKKLFKYYVNRPVLTSLFAVESQHVMPATDADESEAQVLAWQSTVVRSKSMMSRREYDELMEEFLARQLQTLQSALLENYLMVEEINPGQQLILSRMSDRPPNLNQYVLHSETLESLEIHIDSGLYYCKFVDIPHYVDAHVVGIPRILVDNLLARRAQTAGRKQGVGSKAKSKK